MEKIVDIFETSSENAGRISGFGCQHFSMTSYLHSYKSNVQLRNHVKRKKTHLFPPTVLLTIISEPAAFAEGFAKYILTVGRGSIQVAAAFFLVISKQLYRKNLHQDKEVPLLS